MDLKQDAVKTAWQHTFVEGPYSSLLMVDFLLKWQDTTLEEFVKSPKASLAGVKKEKILADPLATQQLSQLWLNRTGRCTSFALKVIAVLEEQLPNIFRFHTFDLPYHRLARCNKTSLLVDSGAAEGPIKLPDTGVWVSTDADRSEW